MDSAESAAARSAAARFFRPRQQQAPRPLCLGQRRQHRSPPESADDWPRPRPPEPQLAFGKPRRRRPRHPRAPGGLWQRPVQPTRVRDRPRQQPAPPAFVRGAPRRLPARRPVPDPPPLPRSGLQPDVPRCPSLPHAGQPRPRRRPALAGRTRLCVLGRTLGSDCRAQQVRGREPDCMRVARREPLRGRLFARRNMFGADPVNAAAAAAASSPARAAASAAAVSSAKRRSRCFLCRGPFRRENAGGFGDSCPLEALSLVQRPYAPRAAGDPAAQTVPERTFLGRQDLGAPKGPEVPFVRPVAGRLRVPAGPGLCWALAAASRLLLPGGQLGQGSRR